jgi:uncharacterized membrane protein
MPSPADWRLKSCLLFAGITTALQLLLVILGAAGIHIPVLNQLAGFVFITFVPGILLLRILRLHGINPVEAIAYAVGLSLFSVMACGAFINFILPMVGLAHPVTPVPVVLAISILNVVLMVAASLRDRQFQPDGKASQAHIDTNSALLLLLLLLLVILGVLVLEKTGSNIVLIICIIAVAMVFCLGAYRLVVTEDIYPIAIYTISLVLLYQATLISPYFTGSDIYYEYQFSQPVVQTGWWDYIMPGTINSCLSIVISVPVYAAMLHLDSAWVLKAVYPTIFSLMPLVMYRFFRIQTGRLPAFLAAFFFISMPVFSLEMISLGRQQVAELFFALVILLLAERKTGNAAKTAMLIVFALGVSLSHYTLGFINLVYMGALVAIVFILRSKLCRNTWARLTSRTGGLPPQLADPDADSLPIRLLAIASLSIIILSFAWYALVTSGSNLDFFRGTIIVLLKKTGLNIQGLAQAGGEGMQYIFAGQGDVIISAALGLDFSQVPLQGKVFRVIQYITQVLIIAGCLRAIIKPSGLKFNREYLAFSFVSALVLAACLILPWFTNILNITRWYHIALITLAPFLVIGAQSLWELASWALQKARPSAGGPLPGNERPLYYLAMLILLPYFIFTSGLVYELSSQSDTSVVDTPYSFSLSGNRIDLTGTFNRQDGAAALWLSRNTNRSTTVYSDFHARKIILFMDYPAHLTVHYFDQRETPFEEGYAYFTSWNTGHDELAFVNVGKPGMREHHGIQQVPGLQQALKNGQRIYVNGGSEIYRLAVTAGASR